VANFCEDLRKMIGASLAHVVFMWVSGFGEFLREREKRRKIVSGESSLLLRSLQALSRGQDTRQEAGGVRGGPREQVVQKHV
jgi:hypothetical protein